MDDLISRLSEIRSGYNCFNEDEEPFYHALSDAIRILSQRADSDTISRAAAIDAMANTLWHYPNEYYRNLNVYEFARGLVEFGLKSVPTAQPEPQWTPVTEDKPKDGEEVFVYLFDNPKSPYIAWVEGGRWYTEEFEVDREYEPLAWMPLPEPWKGEKE